MENGLEYISNDMHAHMFHIYYALNSLYFLGNIKLTLCIVMLHICLNNVAWKKGAGDNVILVVQEVIRS